MQELIARIRAVMRRNFSDLACEKFIVGLLPLDKETHYVTLMASS